MNERINEILNFFIILNKTNHLHCIKFILVYTKLGSRIIFAYA
jgi:hypothetical protein